MECWYIGSFPPPYGGVTKKNVVVFETLKKYIDIRRIEAVSSKIALVKQFLLILKRNCFYVIGIGGLKNLKRYLYLMRICNPSALERTIVMIPGGFFHSFVKQSGISYIKILRRIRSIYAETEGMVRSLTEMGLENVKLFPNCRNNISNIKPGHKFKGKLRCIFFSMVSLEKGIDIYLEAAEKNPYIQFDIYGELKLNNRNKINFEKFCNRLENVSYKGCFKGKNDEVYSLLTEYDLLIFPSRWKYEGVPGVLVEAKISALPAVVSDINYNTEIVTNNIDGIVLEVNDAGHLTEALKKLDEDRRFLYQLAQNAKESAERYSIDYYEAQLLKDVMDSADL